MAGDDAIPVRIVANDAYEHADRVRINHSKTAKGWSYETTVEIHRLPDEPGEAWMDRAQAALRRARAIAVQERDDRNTMDGLGNA